MEKLSQIQRVEIADGFSWRNIDEELIALNLSTGEYHTFNDVGRTIWLSIAEGEGVEGAAAAVVNEYDIDVETAKADVRQFIELLGNKGLLKVYS